MNVKNKEHAIKLLEDGEQISFRVWMWPGTYISCAEPGCCDDTYKSINEAVETLGAYCNGNWEECEVE